MNLVLAWLWLQQLQRWYLKGKKGKGKEEEERAMKVIKDKYAGLGSMNLHEAQVNRTMDNRVDRGQYRDNPQISRTM